MTARTHERRTSQRDDRVSSPGCDGVGARHRGSLASFQGGGYQNNCNSFEVLDWEKKSADEIFQELKEMGLRDDLLRLAQSVGADSFVRMWHFLSINYEQKDSARFRVYFPRFESYQKLLRDNLILNLHHQEQTPTQIKKHLSDKKIELSIRSIERIIRRHAGEAVA